MSLCPYVFHLQPQGESQGYEILHGGVAYTQDGHLGMDRSGLSLGPWGTPTPTYMSQAVDMVHVCREARKTNLKFYSMEAWFISRKVIGWVDQGWVCLLSLELLKIYIICIIHFISVAFYTWAAFGFFTLKKL